MWTTASLKMTSFNYKSYLLRCSSANFRGKYNLECLITCLARELAAINSLLCYAQQVTENRKYPKLFCSNKCCYTHKL